MLFDGNKNGSETHDDLPLGFVAPRACSYRVRSCRSKRSFIASLSVSSCELPPLYADSAPGAPTTEEMTISWRQRVCTARLPAFASLCHFASQSRCRWSVAAPALSLAALLSLLVPPSASQPQCLLSQFADELDHLARYRGCLFRGHFHDRSRACSCFYCTIVLLAWARSNHIFAKEQISTEDVGSGSPDWAG
jgi:hypothetical protein